jgi:hypothetical protein
MNTRLQEMNVLKGVTTAVSSNGRIARIKQTQRVGNPPPMRWCGEGRHINLCGAG